jgi:hypothetical protein
VQCAWAAARTKDSYFQMPAVKPGLDDYAVDSLQAHNNRNSQSC